MQKKPEVIAAKTYALARSLIATSSKQRLSIEKTKQLLSATIAISIGSELDVPTDPAVIPLQYYNSTEGADVELILSQINEQMPIPYKEIRGLVFDVWYTRFSVASGGMGILNMSHIMEKSVNSSGQAREAYSDLHDTLKEIVLHTSSNIKANSQQRPTGNIKAGA